MTNELRPDDNEPITMYWWIKLFGERRLVIGDDFHLYLTIHNVVRIEVESEVDRIKILPHIKTRGDLRRLCDVLGVDMPRGCDDT